MQNIFEQLRKTRLPLEGFLSLMLGYALAVGLAQLLMGRGLLPSSQEEVVASLLALVGVPLTLLVVRGLLLRGQKEQLLLKIRANSLVRLSLLLSTLILSMVVGLSSHDGLDALLARTDLGEQLGFLAQNDLLKTLILILVYLIVLGVLVRLATMADAYRHIGDLVVMPMGTAAREQLERAVHRRIRAYTFLYASLSLLLEGFFLFLRYQVFSSEMSLQQGIGDSQGFWLWRFLSDGSTIIPSLFFLSFVLFLKRTPLAALHRQAVEWAAADLSQEGIPVPDSLQNAQQQGPSPMEAIGFFGVLSMVISMIVCGLIYFLTMTVGAGLLAGGWR